MTATTTARRAFCASATGGNDGYLGVCGDALVPKRRGGYCSYTTTTFDTTRHITTLSAFSEGKFSAAYGLAYF